MKTKTFLMLCLLAGIGLTQLSAQPLPHNGKTGAVTFINTINNWFQPVICDGKMVDYLEGSATYHLVFIYKDGVLTWSRQHAYEVDIHSTNPPYETFKISEIDKGDEINGIVTWHNNLIGNYGSHYLCKCTWDFINDIFVIDRIKCPGNNQ